MDSMSNSWTFGHMFGAFVRTFTSLSAVFLLTVVNRRDTEQDVHKLSKKDATSLRV